MCIDQENDIPLRSSLPCLAASRQNRVYLLKEILKREKSGILTIKPLSAISRHPLRSANVRAHLHPGDSREGAMSTCVTRLTRKDPFVCSWQLD